MDYRSYFGLTGLWGEKGERRGGGVADGWPPRRGHENFPIDIQKMSERRKGGDRNCNRNSHPLLGGFGSLVKVYDTKQHRYCLDTRAMDLPGKYLGMGSG